MQAHMQVGLHVQFIALSQNHGIEGFFIEHYIHEIYNLLQNDSEKSHYSLVSSNKPSLDTDILLCLHFHEQCVCLKPTWVIFQGVAQKFWEDDV